MSQAIVVIQGHLKPTPNAQEIYKNYLKGTVPLMKKYKVSIFAVGPGIQNENTTSVFSINALLLFPSSGHCNKFFSDPGYQKIKSLYRDKAYASLDLSAFECASNESNSSLIPPSTGTLTLVLNNSDVNGFNDSDILPFLRATGQPMSFANKCWSDFMLWIDTPSHLKEINSAPNIRVTQWNNRLPHT